MRTWSIAIVLAAGCRSPAPATPAAGGDEHEADDALGEECVRVREIAGEICAEDPDRGACERDDELPTDEAACRELADALTATPGDIDDDPDEEEDW